MQTPFLLLYGVSLIAFSLFVTRVVRFVPFVIAQSPIPTSEWLAVAGWFVLFLVSFVATGLYLYERERDEGRIARRIGVYEWLLSRRRRSRLSGDASPRPIRRPSEKT
jgi:hypothetical protein